MAHHTGRWFRDYLYIPLGGNQKGAGRTCLNLSIVFILCGLWHGANWTFVLWEIYHGAMLILERISGIRNLPAEKFQAVRRMATLLLVILGWVFFRSANISQSIQGPETVACGALDGPHDGSVSNTASICLIPVHQARQKRILSAPALSGGGVAKILSGRPGRPDRAAVG
ncbi:MAG: hypothetical protein GY850_05715 [bacterium]|nr:hypothetical protein [bacterium]